MASPFFRNHWQMPSYPRYSANMEGNQARRQSTPTPTAKVVSIPVQFIKSERSRVDSALKIQKVYRGFVVRKSVKRISAIRSEVIEIEKRISERETVELIRSNSKEQVKLNEILMNLLIRLDSVRGVDYGVRDLRKVVINKAIALQESLDSIVAGDKTLGATGEDLAASGNGDVADKVSEQPTESTDSVERLGDVDSEVELENHVEANSGESEVKLTESTPISSESEVVPADGAQQLKEPDKSLIMEEENTENVVDSIELQTDVKNQNTASGIESLEESIGTSQTESNSSANEGGESEKQENEMEIDKPDQKIGIAEFNCTDYQRNENKRSTEILEKLMEDNGKMMGLMTKLYERNEMQTQLLSSLSQRVDQLERAFVNDKLRRKKKWQAAGLIDGFESSDQRKCGKR